MNFRHERFGYLDNKQVDQKLSDFKSDHQTNVTLSLPQIHCSSCIYLLENLARLDDGIIKSQADFRRREIFIIFNPKKTTLRKIVELLAFIGYEPRITLDDVSDKKYSVSDKQKMYALGIAGFCFVNIMMLSFPEYFSSGNLEQKGLRETFSFIIMGLSLPVLFFSASTFFVPAFKGLRQHFVNIDLPISVAILITYLRSFYEILSGHGSGYLDSGSGIVFFMLIGRWFQDKTYYSLSFERNYKSYFPLGITLLQSGKEINVPVMTLKKGDRIIVRNQEMIPADAVVYSSNGNIDYSFISGESSPVKKNAGEMIYAGGKQMGSSIELEVISDISNNQLSKLWNNAVFRKPINSERSFIHPWSRYFTAVLLSIAALTGVFWAFADPSRTWLAVSSVLIVACPCSLLLSATFTYGNVLRILGKHQLYLKNANVIQAMAEVDTIVFDKTGTLTKPGDGSITYNGMGLSETEEAAIKLLSEQSSHPLNKRIAAYFKNVKLTQDKIGEFNEAPGQGMTGRIGNMIIRIGSAAFLRQIVQDVIPENRDAHVHVSINSLYKGRFIFTSKYREGIDDLADRLCKKKYNLYVLSGDNDSEKNNLDRIFRHKAVLAFKHLPQQKLDFIKTLQAEGKKVITVGDGLNDAGALKQSNVGIAISDQSAYFSPACDAILDSSQIATLDSMLRFAKSGKTIVAVSFIIAMLYNIIGLSFAVQGNLSPLIAAILMPASSITIIVLATVMSSLNARMMGL